MRWVERHPAPDRPLVAFGDEELVSPRRLAQAAGERDSPLAERFFRSVETTLTEVPFEIYLASVERSGRPRNRVLRFLLGRATRARARLARGRLRLTMRAERG